MAGSNQVAQLFTRVSDRVVDTTPQLVDRRVARSNCCREATVTQRAWEIAKRKACLGSQKVGVVSISRSGTDYERPMRLLVVVFLDGVITVVRGGLRFTESLVCPGSAKVHLRGVAVTLASVEDPGELVDRLGISANLQVDLAAPGADLPIVRVEPSGLFDIME